MKTFLKAMWIAARTNGRHLPMPRRIYRLFLLALKLILHLLHLTPRASKELYEARMNTCRVCTIFNHELGTCGTAGKSYYDHGTGRYEQIGCLCLMKTKVKFPLTDKTADCWLAVMSDGQRGWAKELRPTN